MKTMFAIAALAVLCWLFTWNEFLFALILTGNRVPVITVVMAQFVTEMGLRWNLMAATAVMALVPAFLIALVVIAFAQCVLKRTVAGRYIVAIGTNETAARISGISIWARVTAMVGRTS